MASPFFKMETLQDEFQQSSTFDPTIEDEFLVE
jgi:hypothetical protein